MESTFVLKMESVIALSKFQVGGRGPIRVIGILFGMIEGKFIGTERGQRVFRLRDSWGGDGEE